MTMASRSERQIIFSLLIVSSAFIIVVIYFPRPFNRNRVECDGTVPDPITTAFYRKTFLDPSTLFEELEILHSRFHTVIFDCPQSYAIPSKKYNAHKSAWLKTLIKFNQRDRLPLNFWLRLDKIDDANAEVAFCADMVLKANAIAPGTIRGILVNSDILMGVASGAIEQRTTFDDGNFQPSCKWYMEECFDRLNAQGVQVGLVLNSGNCQAFSPLVPFAIADRFNEIFYLEEKISGMTFGNGNVPTLAASKYFKECKSLVAGREPKIRAPKYVIEEKYEIHLYWINSPFCLKFV